MFYIFDSPCPLIINGFNMLSVMIIIIRKQGPSLIYSLMEVIHSRVVLIQANLK